MDAPRLFALPLDVHVAAVRHPFLGQVEIIAFGVMGAVGRKRSVRRPLEHVDPGILFLDARDRFVHVIDIDAEMMEPRHVAGLSADHGDPDVAVADAQRVVGADRLLFLLGARLRSPHPENRLVKPRLAHEVLADDGGVLDSGEHDLRPPAGLSNHFPYKR